MPREKEPQFFNWDFGNRKYRGLTSYEKLFAEAGPAHLAVGEATVRYLYSRCAVTAIERYVEGPRYIVLIRNPAEMAPSLHEQTMFTGDENEPSFERAWALQAVRAYGSHVPSSCRDPQILQYGPLCRLGEQLDRLLRLVPGERVLILNLDQVRADPRREYMRVLDFLQVPDDGRAHFPVQNTSKRRRFPVVWSSVRRLNRALNDMGVPHVRLGVTAFIQANTRQERQRAPLSEALRTELLRYFHDDVLLLEDLTGYDLSAWRE